MSTTTQPPRLPFVLAEALSVTSGEAVLDLAEYAHPDAVARLAAGDAAAGLAVDGAPLVPLIPAADPSPDVLALIARLGCTRVALDRVESAAQVHAARQALERLGARGAGGAAPALVARLTTGAGLQAAEAIAAAGVEALWYAPADLVDDFDPQPPDLYFYDADAPRLAESSWVRSRCLTIARAYGVALWGQLDVTYADAPDGGRAARASRLAEASGFDLLVTRHP
jgi:hypothetical protein